jgi:ribonuclease BN (tRNA processing enzyme)
MLELYKGAEIVVLNVQEPSGKHEPGHLSADDAVLIFKELKPKLGVITHFGAKMIMADPMMVAREIQTKVGNVQVIAVKDGLTIDPMTILIALKRDFSL